MLRIDKASCFDDFVFRRRDSLRVDFADDRLLVNHRVTEFRLKLPGPRSDIYPTIMLYLIGDYSYSCTFV